MLMLGGPLVLGEMTSRLGAVDWSGLNMTPPSHWPIELRVTLRQVMNSASPAYVGVGSEQRFFYNDAYREILAEKHPAALGLPMREVWKEAWEDVRPIQEAAFAGEIMSMAGMPFRVLRHGRLEEARFTFITSPVHLADGSVAGVFCSVFEDGRAAAALAEESDAEHWERRRSSSDRRTHDQAMKRDELWTTTTDLLSVMRADGSFMACNPAWTQVLGWEEDELRSRSALDIVHPDDRDRTASAFAGLNQGEALIGLESRFHHKRDGYRWLSWNSSLFEGRIVSTARDVTERRVRFQLYRNIVESTPSPICAYDKTQRVIAFNEAHARDWQRFIGRPAELGEVLPDAFPPDQAEAQRGFAARALAGEKFTVEANFGDPDFATPHWALDYAPIRDEFGDIIGAFHHARDLTERDRIRANLAQAEEALRQSQKLEAIGQLTGGVAHDFNNLLTIIRGSVDLLRRPNLTDDKRDRYIDAIGETADRAAKLTGQLLAFARRQALSPELTDIGAAVDHVSDMIRTLVGPRVTVSLDAPKQPCMAELDRSQFETAIVNMAINARDAMNGEGQLKISIGPVSGVPSLRSHPALSGDFVAVSITDTGTGIHADDLVRIFEPFFTTKVIGKGTGLGLSQVIGFAKQTGGDVSVESTPGEGATFCLYVPQVLDGQIDKGELPDIAQARTGDGLYVLLVEDNPEVGEFARAALEELGYKSFHALSAEEALTELERDADRFDVVFSDVVMPGMNGVELGNIIRTRYPEHPVVLTSGYSHVLAENGQHGFELLHKPYSIEQLSRVLRNAVAWRLRRSRAR